MRETAAGSKARPVLIAGLIVALAVALGGGLLLGTLLGPGSEASATPGESSVDVGFARDMKEHHSQAVQMSVLVRDATEDPQVRRLALDVMLTQQQQQGQMYGWLAGWGRDQASSTPPMAWMSDQQGSGDTMSMGSGSMPGMASSADLERLTTARGEKAERLYLQLMIPHHRAGVMMAEAAVKTAGEAEVRQLAESILISQSAELKVLRSMLSARGGGLPST